MKKILSVLVLFSVISGFSIAAFATQDITRKIIVSVRS
jgi:hypothetical protein